MKKWWILCFALGCSLNTPNAPNVPIEDTTTIEQNLPRADGCDPACEICPPSPILLDMNGNGFQLTDAAHGVDFDVAPGGPVESVSWTAPGSDDAWLVLDRNGDGLINNGNEMFGNFTHQPESTIPNGFLALGLLDSNYDNRIDAQDPAFYTLRLWNDANHDGVSQPEELSTLASHGITSISDDFKAVGRVDNFGNTFRYQAKVQRNSSSSVGPLTYDVFLLLDTGPVGAKPSGCSGNGCPNDCQIYLTRTESFTSIGPNCSDGHIPLCAFCDGVTDSNDCSWVDFIIPGCQQRCLGQSSQLYCTYYNRRGSYAEGDTCPWVNGYTCPSLYIAGTNTPKCDSRLL